MKINELYDEGVKDVNRGTVLMLISGAIAALGTVIGAAFVESGSSKKSFAQAYTDVISGTTTFDNYAVVELDHDDKNED